MIETFRTKEQTWKDCPRKRWWAYEFPTGGKVNGIGREGFSRYLLLGSGLHEGLRVQLQGGTTDEGAEIALKIWDEGIQSQGLVSPDGKEWVTEIYEWIVKQDRALLEGMVRGFGVWMLPGLLEEFTILETEIDRVYQQKDFRWIIKLDALMERKSTLELYVMSFKGYSWWGNNQERAAKVDDQNYGEPWGMEGVMRGWWETLTTLATQYPDPEAMVELSDGVKANGWFVIDQLATEKGIPEWFRNRYAEGQYPEPPVVSGVMMGVLKKGQERKDKNGVPKRYSPWVMGWCKEGEFDIASGEQEMEWAWSYEVPKVGKNGEEYVGKLGSTWQAFYSWDLPGGTKQWVEMLASGTVQPECGEVGEKQFVFTEPHLSQEWEKERWARQVMAQEGRVDVLARTMRELWEGDGPETEKLELLDEWFPQNTKSCFDFNSQCGFFGLCFDNPAGQLDPLGTGLYRIRESHHEEEGEGED